MRPRLYASSRRNLRLCCSLGIARVSAPIRPPHMPRQWPPPSRPRISAETSSGAKSSMGRIFGGGGVLGAIGLVDGGQMVGVLIVEQHAVGRPIEVVVLAAVHCPEEDIDGDGHNQQRRWNHYV